MISTNVDMCCSLCSRPFGVRKRCYYCQAGRKRSRVERSCPTCGKAFEVQTATANDTARNSGTYCSRDCKHDAQRGRAQSWHDPSKKKIHSAGYVLIWMPHHPRSAAGRVLEHIVVMESKIGRPLQPAERVHHIDGNKQNNHPDNLQLMANDSEHAKLHARLRKGLC